MSKHSTKPQPNTSCHTTPQQAATHLARAVVPEESEALVLVHGEREVLDRDLLATGESLAEVEGPNHHIFAFTSVAPLRPQPLLLDIRWLVASLDVLLVLALGPTSTPRACTGDTELRRVRV